MKEWMLDFFFKDKMTLIDRHLWQNTRTDKYLNAENIF